jgi:ribosomal protein S18 acetylase RimI-like enzyme
MAAYPVESATSIMTKLNRSKQQALRQVQEHVNWVRRRRGVLFEQTSTVDVYYHPRQTAATYNYVTPRRGAAWVPGTDVRKALDRLAELDRVPRLEMVRGLFPEAFHAQLKKAGLVVENDYPVLTYGPIPGCDQEDSGDYPPVPALPPYLSVYGVADPNAVATWLRLRSEDGIVDAREVKQVWENVVHGQEMCFLVSDDFTIAGGASAIINPPAAEIVCADTFPLHRRRGIASAAIRTSVQYAQARGCSLIFLIAVNDAVAHLSRRLGFVDLDRLITYCRSGETSSINDCPASEREGETEHVVAQPVLPRR